MLEKLTKALIILFTILAPMACAVGQKKSRVESVQTHSKEVGPYYYYTQSHLVKKQGDIGKAIELLGQAVARDEDSVFLKTELARLYIQHNDYNQALRITEEIVEKDPANVASIMLLAGVYATLNQHPEAIEAYEKALLLDPESERIHLLLGSEYVKNKKPETALELYEKLTDVHPESFSGFYHLGTVAASMKRYDLAKKAFARCLELKPDYEHTLFELVNVYEATDSHEEVLATYKKILNNKPDNIKAAVGLGQYYLKLGQGAEAEKVFDELKLRSQSNPLVVKQIALIYLDQKYYSEAAETLDILLGQSPDNPEIHYFRGMAFEGLKKTEKAISAYEKVGETSSYHRSALVHLSFLYQEKGDREKAIEKINKALEQEPDEPEPYLFLGALYEEMESYPEAIDALKKGLLLQPGHIRLHFRLGVVYDKAGDKDACINEMKTVIEIDPTHAEALNYLGYTYAELETNLEEAEELIKRAMELKPNDGYITDSLGWVYFKQGEFGKAVKFLEEAARLAPDDPTILEHLADALSIASQYDEALMYYKKALEKTENDRGPIEEKLPQPKRNSRKPIRIALGIATGLFLSACFSSCSSSTRAFTVLPESGTAHFVAQFLQRQKDFPGFRGLGKLKIRGSGTPKTMRVAWIGSQSGKLRMEMLGPWGQPLATLLVTKSIFYLYVVKDNICYQGKSTARSLSRILSVRVRNEDLVTFLSGQPPLPEFYKAKVQRQQSDGQQTMTLYGRWNRILQKMWFMDDQKTVERVETFDGFGDVKYTVIFSEFEQHGEYLVPYRIQISKNSGTDLLLNMERFQMGISTPDGAFELDLSDAKVVDLES